jgi:integration host factor subunit beta
MIAKNMKTKTYTKQDIVKRVASVCNEDLQNTAKWVNEIFTAIREILVTANPSVRIEIRDFGVIEVKPTKSKPKARNPKSGEIIYVPAHRKTHFKPSKLLKKFLSKPLDENLNSVINIKSTSIT